LTREALRTNIELRRTRPDRGDSRKELNMNLKNTRTLAGVALFTAVVAVLQALGTAIRLGPFSISLVLIPIVVGAALYGQAAGAWLGFVFGLVVLFTDTALFMPISPLGTVLTVLGKGAAAGFCAGFVYRKLEKVNGWLAVIAAAVVCPVVNTGLFLVGCKLFFMSLINEWAAGAGFANAGSYMIFALVGANFLAELVTNIVLSPVIVRLIKLGRRGWIE